MNLKMLDVIIGVVFFFTFASLICTTVLELIESLLATRAKMLEAALREILRDESPGRVLAPTSPESTKSVLVRFYEHPMIASLFKGDYKSAALDGSRVANWTSRFTASVGNRNLPAYIPSDHFATALLDVVAESDPKRPAYDSALSPEDRKKKQLIDLRTKLHETEILKGNPNEKALIPNNDLKAAVLWALDNAADLDQAKKHLESWYDNSMERATGWYKRYTQSWLLVIGAVVAFGLNMNSVEVVRRLYQDDGMRAEALSAANKLIEKPTIVRDETHQTTAMAFSATPTQEDIKATNARIDQLKGVLEQAGFPIGWTTESWNKFVNAAKNESRSSDEGLSLLSSCLGWLLTAIGVTLGASFWFDLLNKLVSVRSSLKPLALERAAKKN